MNPNQRAVLAFMVADPDGWWAHCQARLGERAGAALAAKVARWRPEHEAALAAGQAVTRAERDAAALDAVQARLPLADIKATARVRVAAAAEAQRQRYITPGPGKALVYEAKLREARSIVAYLAEGGEPDPADHPFAAARAELLDVGLEEVAAEWLARTAAWATAGAAIEAAYEAGVAAINAAGDAAAVAAAVAAVAWPEG